MAPSSWNCTRYIIAVELKKSETIVTNDFKQRNSITMRASSTDILDFSVVEGERSFYATKFTSMLPDETTDYSSEEFNSYKSDPSACASISNLSSPTFVPNTNSRYDTSLYPTENSDYNSTVLHDPTIPAPQTSLMHSSAENNSSLDNPVLSPIRFYPFYKTNSSNGQNVNAAVSTTLKKNPDQAEEQAPRGVEAGIQADLFPASPEIIWEKSLSLLSPQPANIDSENGATTSRKSIRQLLRDIFMITIFALFVVAIICLTFQLTSLQKELASSNALSIYKEASIDNHLETIDKYRQENVALQSEVHALENRISSHDKEFHVLQ